MAAIHWTFISHDLANKLLIAKISLIELHLCDICKKRMKTKFIQIKKGET